MRWLVFLLTLVAAQTANSQEFRSAESGDWNEPSTWEELIDGTWVNSSAVPDSLAAQIELRSNHVVNISDSTYIKGILNFDGGTLQLNAGGLIFSGVWNVNSGGILTSETAALHIEGEGELSEVPLLEAENRLNQFKIYRLNGDVTLGANLSVKRLLLEGGVLNNDKRLLIEENGAVNRTAAGSLTGNTIETQGGYNLLYYYGSGLGGFEYVEPFITGAEFSPLSIVTINVPDTWVKIDPSIANVAFQNMIVAGILSSEESNITIRDGFIDCEFGQFIIDKGDLTFEGEVAAIWPNGFDVNNLIFSNDAQVGLRRDMNVRGDIIVGDGVSLDYSLSNENQTFQLRGEKDQRIIANGARFNTIIIQDSSRNVEINGNFVLEGSIEDNSSSNIFFSDLDTVRIEGGYEGFNHVIDISPATWPTLIIDRLAGRYFFESPLDITGNIIFKSPTVLESNGNIRIRSNGINDSTGNVFEIPQGGRVLGEVLVENIIEGNAGTQVVANPVDNSAVKQWQDDFPIYGMFQGSSDGNKPANVFAYNEAIPGDIFDGLEAFPANTNEEFISAGKGYNADVEGGDLVLVDVTGEFISGDFEFNLSLTNNGFPATDGWNLLGNPYQAAIQWSDQGWTREDVSKGIVVQQGDDFLYWNGTNVGSESDILIRDGIIPRASGFWAHAYEDETSTPRLSISESAKVDPANPPEYEPHPLDITVVLENNTFSDQTIVAGDRRATNDYDPEMDIPKFGEKDLSIYSLSTDNIAMAINMVSVNGEVPLGITTDINGTHELTFRDVGDNSCAFLLTDALNDISVGVLNPYEFQVDLTRPETFENRFFLAIDDINLDSINTTISTPEVFCEGSSVTVDVIDAKAGITYQLLVNDIEYGSPFTSDGSAITIQVEPDVLNEANSFKIETSTCAGFVIIDETSNEVFQSSISIVDEVLISSSQDNNEWYFDNQLISTSQEVIPASNGEYTLRVSANGCISESIVLVDFVEDEVVSIEADSQFDVYPNPFADKIIIPTHVSGESNVRLISMTGKIMIDQEVSAAAAELSTQHIPPGLYLLIIERENKRIAVRMAKY